MTTHPAPPITKLPTGITGFDLIAQGGIPESRSTIVAGSAGAGKTIFGLQFLQTGLRQYGEPGVLVTFEEQPADLFRNVLSFGWDLAGAVDAGQLAIVDGTPEPGQAIMPGGHFDLSALSARVEHAIRKVGARRILLDSIGALFGQLHDVTVVRLGLYRILAALRRMKVTSIITLERAEEEGGIGRFGVEEFVADNVVVLRNRLELEKRRRTVEILKLRGAGHQKGEYPFTIDPRDGVSISPLSAIELKQSSSEVRVSSGVATLDTMCGGGLYRDSVILVSGATGTGKTLTVTHFLQAGIAAGERVLLVASEESREQLARNARMWGTDFDAAEARGLLRIVCRYPEAMGLEDHMLLLRRELEEFQPHRLGVDSITAFERGATPKAFREFIVGLTSTVKQREITGLFTNTTAMLGGGESVTDSHFSTITDTIVLLRYVELFGQMHRGLAVLKMRGSWHDPDIREYRIDGTGMHIGEPFRGVHGILLGTPSYSFTDERSRMQEMFGAAGRPRPEGTA